MLQHIDGLKSAAEQLVPKSLSAHDKTIRKFVAVAAMLQTACSNSMYGEHKDIGIWAQKQSMHWNGVLSSRYAARKQSK